MQMSPLQPAQCRRSAGSGTAGWPGASLSRQVEVQHAGRRHTSLTRGLLHDHGPGSTIGIRATVCIAAALALSGGAHAQTVTAPGFDSTSHVYRCTGGAKVPVVYLNLKDGNSFATLYVNGRLVLMRAGPTGSGASYSAVDEQFGYRWQTKGEVGNLYFRAAGHTASETLVLQDCKVQRLP